MTYDCGCWTNAEGFWELSPECQAHERLAWQRMLEQIRDGDYMESLRMSRKKAPKFVYIDKKLRLIEDVQLPEDTTE
jgi:hypothetical protein